MKREGVTLSFMTAVFIGSLLAANVIAVKLVMVFGTIQPAGIIAYPITFLVTDIVSEVWGKKAARQMVVKGFIAQLAFLLFVTLARFMKFPGFWEGQAAFNAVLGAVPRIVLASLVAYIVSQMHDVWAFNMWKQKTRGRHLWLRNNLSTVASQAIDTVLFVTIAFAGIFDMHHFFIIMLTQYVSKVLIAGLDTPLCYLGVYVARRRVTKEKS